MTARIDSERKMLSQTEKSSGLKNPFYLIETSRISLDKTAKSIDSAIRMKIEKSRAELSHLAGKTDVLSPLKVLARGYSITEKEGTAVSSISEIDTGDDLVIRFSDGKVSCTVNKKEVI